MYQCITIILICMDLQNCGEKWCDYLHTKRDLIITIRSLSLWRFSNPQSSLCSDSPRGIPSFTAFKPGAIAGSMFCEHLPDASVAALLRPLILTIRSLSLWRFRSYLSLISCRTMPGSSRLMVTVWRPLSRDEMSIVLAE